MCYTLQPSSLTKSGTDADVCFDDEDGFLLLDDLLEPSTNIDMVMHAYI